MILDPNNPRFPPKSTDEPYAPLPGYDDLPSLRYVIFADLDNFVQHIDEAAPSIEGYWDSPSLNRGSEQGPAVWTLNTLLFYYTAAEDYPVSLWFTANGGRIWTNERRWTLKASSGGVRSDQIGVNVTGYDLRFRVGFSEAKPVNLFAYRVKMIPRGTLVDEGR